MKPIAVMFRRFGPYHDARLRAAARAWPVIGIEATTHDTEYAWSNLEGGQEYQRTTLFPTQDPSGLSRNVLQRTVSEVLRRSKPCVVAIPGWSDKISLAALRWCLSSRTPAVLMSDSHALGRTRGTPKELLKRRVLRCCGSALGGGTAQADYLVTLGVKRDRVFLGYDVVDNDYFAAGAAESRKRKAEIAAKLGLPQCYFLVVARFIEEKNLLRLVSAYAKYRVLATRSVGRHHLSLSERPWDLVLVGDGPMRRQVEAHISEPAIQNAVHIAGFKQYQDLPCYYALAGALVLPSVSETWGLVVNEAMASGLPVLVSDRCGCAADLVQEGVNGFIFDPFNVEQLSQLMLRISSPDFPLSAFGDACRRIIADWGPDRFAQGLKQAAECALQVGPKEPSLIDRALLKALMFR